MIACSTLSASILVLLGITRVFWVALVLLALWALVYSAAMPVRQAYLNDMIASKQRATVLSFDSLMGSSGGVVVQPLLGRAADLYGYAASLAISGVIELAAVPFLLASRRQRARADLANAAPGASNTEPQPT
jgi:MFS family permease